MLGIELRPGAHIQDHIVIPGLHHFHGLFAGHALIRPLHPVTVDHVLRRLEHRAAREQDRAKKGDQQQFFHGITSAICKCVGLAHPAQQFFVQFVFFRHNDVVGPAAGPRLHRAIDA